MLVKDKKLKRKGVSIATVVVEKAVKRLGIRKGKKVVVAYKAEPVVKVVDKDKRRKAARALYGLWQDKDLKVYED